MEFVQVVRFADESYVFTDDAIAEEVYLAALKRYPDAEFTSEQVIERGDILNAILEELVDEDATPTPCAYDCGDCTQCRAFGEWSEGQD